MAWPATAAATNDVISASQLSNLPVKLQEYAIASDVEAVRFTNFPAWFTHLLIAFSARASGASADADLKVRLNPQNLGELYDTQILIGQGATAAAVEAFGMTYAALGAISGNDTEEGYWSVGWFLIPRYTTTGPKAIVGQVYSPTLKTEVRSTHARTATTGALTTIELFTAGNFASGSVFTLYGLP